MNFNTHLEFEGDCIERGGRDREGRDGGREGGRVGGREGWREIKQKSKRTTIT